jgi:hypothetical protein
VFFIYGTQFSLGNRQWSHFFVDEEPGMIYQMGRQAMVNSKPAHAAVLGPMPPADKQGAVCETAGDLIEQMEETCFYHENEAIYANTAALVMQGFADTFPDVSMK